MNLKKNKRKIIKVKHKNIKLVFFILNFNKLENIFKINK